MAAAESQYSRTALVRATTRPWWMTIRLYASDSTPAEPVAADGEEFGREARLDAHLGQPERGAGGR